MTCHQTLLLDSTYNIIIIIIVFAYDMASSMYYIVYCIHVFQCNYDIMFDIIVDNYDIRAVILSDIVYYICVQSYTYDIIACVYDITYAMS